jgi:two-component system, NtrC family, response regulator PilR
MKTILLVEDRPELREMLVTALQRMSYAVLPAANSTEALVAIARQKFSLVLTDLKLPDGSGMDVLKAAVEANREIPVVIMTAFGGVPEAVAAVREGAFDFIQKPIDLDQLKDLLTKAIGTTEPTMM